jgi:hypothetical protein
MVTATATVNEQMQASELRGLLLCESRRSGRTVVLQSAKWKGQKTTANQYTATVTLKIPARGAKHFIVLYIDDKPVTELPIEVQ